MRDAGCLEKRALRRIGWLSAVLAVVALAGCGYHLRTWDLAGSVQTAKIVSNPRNPLAEPLGRALAGAGVEVLDSGAADVIIELINDRSSRRNVAVTSQARAAEYEATLSVQYRVTDEAGKELIAPRWLRASRVYRVDRGNPVASNQEQALLEREMVGDLVQQLIRGMNAVVIADGDSA